ncbi:DUF397 domain-containing protein [Saccharopolyspora aridisoli]|uniref:DUF397 domain-containing protein n=1 Tax=Saccharopolyspora aridisoli TaxID=2530385 RepID=A0A4R4UZQ8_9PSEU|nr:DUF397 domain-containing protein [Saccharopolyspora aridisoli]TDC94373.1 DUF397 domain-containing protein [Saccharopolyspora aridisoli]
MRLAVELVLVQTDHLGEVGRLGDCAAVRDIKDLEGGYFTFNPTQWAIFLNAVKSDRFTN